MTITTAHASLNLGKVLDITSGFAFKSQFFNQSGNGLPLIRCRDVNTGLADVYYSGEYDDKYVVTHGDLLVSMDGDFRIIKWQHGNALLNQRVCRLEPKNGKLDANYLLHFLPKELDRIHAKTSFATVKHLSAKTLREIEIPLPPLPDQKRIADILDKADAIRRKRLEQRATITRLLPSLFVHVFGRPDAKTLGWPIHPLDEYLDFVTSGSRGWAKYYVPQGKRFIRSLDVQMNHIASTDAVFVDPPPGTETERTRVKAGDVLLTITGSRIGRVAFVPEDMDEGYVSQHVAIIRLKKGLRPRLCSMFMSLPDGGQRQIAKSQYGQTKPGISLTNIRNFEIPVPPLEEQDRFLRMWDAFDGIAESASKATRGSDEMFDSLFQRAFRGEL